MPADFQIKAGFDHGQVYEVVGVVKLVGAHVLAGDPTSFSGKEKAPLFREEDKPLHFDITALGTVDNMLQLLIRNGAADMGDWLLDVWVIDGAPALHPVSAYSAALRALAFPFRILVKKFQ